MEILDLAIAEHAGRSLDFVFDFDELRPPHPFAELLREAFAPEITPQLLLRTLKTEACNPTRVDWDRALRSFAERYGIWEPEE